MERLIAGVEQRGEVLTDRLVAFSRGVPGYANVPEDAIRLGHAEARRLVAPILRGEMSTDSVRRWARGLARSRAQFGIPAESQLRAITAAAREILGAAGEAAAVEKLPAETLALAGQRILEWADTVMAEVTASVGTIEDTRRARFVHEMLFGRARGEALAGFGISEDRSYLPFRIRARTEAALAHAARSVGSEFTTIVGGDVAGFTDRDFSVQEGIDATIGIGPPSRAMELAPAFAIATRALEGSVALGRTGAVRVSDIGLLAAVIDDDSVGDGLVARFIKPLANLGAFGTTLRTTLAAFFDNGMRMDATAATLHVHPNTLRNRFKRYEEITGADLDSADDLVGVWWALKRAALTHSGNDQHL